MTHMPYKPWCQTCVLSRGRDEARLKQETKEKLIPVVQMDYAEAGVENDPHNNFKMIVAKDMASGMGAAIAIQTKGPKDEYAVAAMCSFLKELGHTRMDLRSDNEPAILAFVEAVKLKTAQYEEIETIFTTSGPRHSHQSVGGAERFVQTVRGLMRTFVVQLEEKTGMKVKPDSPILPWALRHAAWVHNRYNKQKETGLTPYEKVHLTKYQRPLLMFGEHCICRRPGAQLNKLDIHWLRGIWLGRDAKTDEHFIGTEGAIVRARAVRRVVEPEQWQKERVEAMIWTPWHTSAVQGRPPKQRTDQEPIALGPVPSAILAGHLDPVGQRIREAAAKAKKEQQQQQGHEPGVRGAGSVSEGGPLQGDATAAAAATAASSSTEPAGMFSKHAREGPSTPPRDKKQRANSPIIAQKALHTPPTTPPSGGGSPGKKLKAEVNPVQANPGPEAMSGIRAICEETPAAGPDEQAVDEKQIYEAKMKHIKKLIDKPVVQRVWRATVSSRPLSCRWVVTTTNQGETKARLTTRGYEQKLFGGEDFYSGTPSLIYLRSLLVLAQAKGHAVAIGDCSGAFYQAPLHEDVWIEPPPEAGEDPQIVWKCERAMPGLKGAPKAWDTHSVKVLTGPELNLKQSKLDGCIFYNNEDQRRSGRHVDDFLITGPQADVEKQIETMKDNMELSDVVWLNEVGSTGVLVGLHITKVVGGFSVQRSPEHVDNIVRELDMVGCKKVKTPEVKHEQPEEDDEEVLNTEEHHLFRKVVGTMIHYTDWRADVQHTVNKLARRVSSPTKGDMRRARRLARYLVGTTDSVLEMIPDMSDASITVYVDSDWADGSQCRKSTSGGVLKLYNVTVATWARTQSTVALSSCEAELYAMGSGAVEALGLKSLLDELGFNLPVKLFTDSSSAKAVAARRGPGKMKHIELRMLALQDWVRDRMLFIYKVATEVNPSDLLTKPMTEERTRMLSRMIGLHAQEATVLNDLRG